MACGAQAATREEDLQALRGRIERLARELEKKEGSEKEARDALRASERAISEANRSLARLGAEARAERAEAARVAERRKRLEQSAAAREGAVERVLVARAMSGTPDVLRVALSGDDPGEIARSLYYLGHLSRAVGALVAEQRAAAAELERLAGEAKRRAERLQAIEQASRTDRDKVLAERKERRKVLDRLAGDIRKNRKEIRVLKADETRLARLVEAIGRGAETTSVKGAFSAQRGKLRLPVRGELTGRFGAPRGGAGTEAKGIFIRAPQGQPVQAVAPGRVVYADWMRGFGNLLIVDHGESYLSIYANNESLLKELGEPVTAGETVALTGSSGGNEETGLYFEMRHLGRAFDPLRWVKLK